MLVVVTKDGFLLLHAQDIAALREGTDAGAVLTIKSLA